MTLLLWFSLVWSCSLNWSPPSMNKTSNNPLFFLFFLNSLHFDFYHLGHVGKHAVKCDFPFVSTWPLHSVTSRILGLSFHGMKRSLACVWKVALRLILFYACHVVEYLGLGVACFENYYKNTFYVEFSHFYGAVFLSCLFFFFNRFRNVKVNKDFNNTLHVFCTSSFGDLGPLSML